MIHSFWIMTLFSKYCYWERVQNRSGLWIKTPDLIWGPCQLQTLMHKNDTKSRQHICVHFNLFGSLHIHVRMCIACCRGLKWGTARLRQMRCSQWQRLEVRSHGRCLFTFHVQSGLPWKALCELHWRPQCDARPKVHFMLEALPFHCTG